MADGKRRSVRQLAERKRSVYYEPETDDDLYIDEKDVDDDDKGEQTYRSKQAPASSQPSRQKKKRKVDRRPKPGTRGKEKRMQKFGGLEAKRDGQTGKYSLTKAMAASKKQRASQTFTGLSDGRIPDWTRLPLAILRDIFVFASQPIHAQTTTASSNVTWLLRSARICRAFALPALEAFYQSPALHTSLQPCHLLELILIPKDTLYMDYRVKVRRLEMDVKRLAYAAHSRPLLQLDELVKELPRLRHLEVIHPAHSPPFRPVKFQRWTYPSSLHQALAASEVRLRSWRWTREMINIGPFADVLYDWMNQVHTSAHFKYLERLVVCGFDVASSGDPPLPENATVRPPPGLSLSIAALPCLKNLTFISCDLIMDDFLEHLPKQLERLELVNCLEITSDLMANYFVTGGSQLRELVLNHNPALDLAFLQHLKALCPRLEVLKMDFTYYSERFTYNDAWAMYDELLTADQIPTWPSTLQHLEFTNMQKLALEAAETLFASLIDNAKDLPNLHHLALQAHINIPWRDRADFRDLWIDRFQTVFWHISPQPDRNLTSMKHFRIWKEGLNKSRRKEDVASDIKSPVPRRFSHIRVTPRKRSASVEVMSDPEPIPTRSTRRSARVAESQSASTAAEESPDSEDEPEGGSRTLPDPSFIQGLCHVVDIRIDNQRPREDQYTEANFLDSEPSGDEDWQSGAELSDDGYAW